MAFDILTAKKITKVGGGTRRGLNTFFYSLKNSLYGYGEEMLELIHINWKARLEVKK